MAPDAAVDQKIKQNLANIKSVLRKQQREKGKRRPGRPRLEPAGAGAGVMATSTPVAANVRRTSPGRLETLEEAIDDCLTMAKHQDREGLHDVIQLLRRAQQRGVEARPVELNRMGLHLALWPPSAKRKLNRLRLTSPPW